jgi:uncharacterized membrane protein YqjE
MVKVLYIGRIEFLYALIAILGHMMLVLIIVSPSFRKKEKHF